MQQAGGVLADLIGGSDLALLRLDAYYRDRNHLPLEERVALASPETVAALEWLGATLSSAPWRDAAHPGAGTWTDAEKNAAFLSGATAYTFTERALVPANDDGGPAACGGVADRHTVDRFIAKRPERVLSIKDPRGQGILQAELALEAGCRLRIDQDPHPPRRHAAFKTRQIGGVEPESLPELEHAVHAAMRGIATGKLL